MKINKHNTNKESWEEEFEKAWDWDWVREVTTKNKIKSLFSKTISQEKEKWVEGLTEKLDTEKMLTGWERYWKEVRPGRFVCMCGECENGAKIINLLQNK